MANNSITATVQTFTGNFLTAENGGGIGGTDDPNQNPFAVHTDAKTARSWETFNFVQGPNPNSFGLQTSSGFFLTAVNGGGIGGGTDEEPIQTNRTIPAEWELFTFNFSSPLKFSPFNALTGLYGPYVIFPPYPNTVTLQAWDGKFVTAVNNGGIDADGHWAISSNRTAMSTWETFTLDNIIPGQTFANIEITIATGGDDLRQDSSASIQFYAINQLDPAPLIINMPFASGWLKASGAPGWGNNTTNGPIVIALPHPVPASVFGAFTISLGEHPNWPETNDNWDIAWIKIVLFNTSNGQITESQTIFYAYDAVNVLSDGSIGIARLTGDQPVYEGLFADPDAGLTPVSNSGVGIGFSH